MRVLLVLVLVVAVTGKPVEEQETEVADRSLQVDDDLGNSIQELIEDLKKEESADKETLTDKELETNSTKADDEEEEKPLVYVYGQSPRRGKSYVDESQFIPGLEHTISTGTISVKGDAKKGRVIEIADDGIPIVHGVRSRDDETDVNTWRNAKVINGQLVESENGGKNTPISALFDIVYPEGRLLNSDSISPSQRDNSNFKPSMPYPAFYYKDYYKDDEKPDLPDNIGIESGSDVIHYITPPNSVHKQEEKKKDRYQYHAGATANGRPVYYVVNSNEDIHSDHSPYVFQPADVKTSIDENPPPPVSSQEGSTSRISVHEPKAMKFPQVSTDSFKKHPLEGNPYVFPAPAGSYTIQRYTYDNNGQTINIPVPIPNKDSGYVSPYSSPTTKTHDNSYYYQPNYNNPYTHSYTNHDSSIRYDDQEKNFFEKLGDQFKDNVQKTFDSMQTFVAPVSEPIVEAGEKIANNLGVSDSLQQINEKFGDLSSVTSSEVLPYVVAGGAALAIGAIGIGFLLNSNFTGSSISIGKRSIDDPTEEFLDNIIDNLEEPKKNLISSLQDWGYNNWQHTPCAKRMFCDVMTLTSDDTINTVEKRIASIISSFESSDDDVLTSLTKELMSAIRGRHCDQFTCGGDGVDTAHIRESGDTHGPR